jgi:DNA transformation protein
MAHRKSTAPRNLPLHLLLNLGPVTARRLAEVGIADEQGLRALGVVAAYRRVKHAFPRETSLNLLYALEGALTDTPWLELTEEAKTRLRREAGGK